MASYYPAVVDLELARHQWAAGRRAVEQARSDPRRYDRLSEQVSVLVETLTQRIGQTFTLEELADAYEGSDRWALEAVHDAFPENLPAEISPVTDAAFDLIARRASDYTP